MATAEFLLVLRIIIAISLFAFLTFMLISLWQDLKSRAQLRLTMPMAHLLTISSESLEPAYQLGEVNLLGRANDNTLTLPETTVSAYHARISFRQGTWWLEDLGSRNGTIINDIPVVEPTIVIFGDEIHLGSVIVQFCAGPVPEIQEGDVDA
jgi:pSer/pThr/pTyr-binding forkhead associated (FHA) protein